MSDGIRRSIQEKFISIMGKHFRPVPSNPDYYFYCLQPARKRRQSSDDGNNKDFNFVKVASDATRFLLSCQPSVCADGQAGGMNSEFNAKMHKDEKITESNQRRVFWDVGDSEVSSLGSIIDTSNDISDMEIEEDEDEERMVNDDVPPFFVHLTCSVRTKHNIGSYTVHSVPTCLGDVLQCLELPGNDVCLAELHATLDVNCLTLPTDLQDTLASKSHGLRSTSFCSSSPVPHELATSAEEIGSDHSSEDGSMENAESDLLQHIPGCQRHAITSTVEEIKWMLQDEIVASMRELPQVSVSTLTAVAAHVRCSSGRCGSMATDVALKFVFGPEKSLARFIQEFCQMRVSGLCLRRKGDYFYMALDTSSMSPLKSELPTLSQLSSSEVDTVCGAMTQPLTPSVGIGDSLLAPDGVSSSVDTLKNDLEISALVDGTDSVDVPAYTAKDNIDQLYGDTCFLAVTRTASSEQLLRTSAAEDEKDKGVLESIGNISDGYEDHSNNEHEELGSEMCEQTAHLPKFWLVMKVCSSKVNVYLHTRVEEYKQGLDVYSLVVKNIKNICKIVNQMLLLQDLYDTHVCNQLLVPESSEDIWKPEDGAQIVERIQKLHVECQDGYLESNMKFMPGAFACKKVWEVNFLLHPRLKTGPGRSGVSRGIQALRTVILTLSVGNRTNMFVYKGHTGAVFYLRLHESQHVGSSGLISDIGYSKSIVGGYGDDSATIVSTNSSLMSLNVNKGSHDFEELLEQPRARVNSLPEKDKEMCQDTMSLSSRISSSSRFKVDNVVTLSIYGVSEAGLDIREGLVQVLQKRLDDAVLEVISITLSRNPACKLTPEDVQFIQRPGEAPKNSVLFMIPARMLTYLCAIEHYLRQSLRQQLHAPKYTDSNIDHHFRDYSDNSSDVSHPVDHNVFLYNNPQAAGNKGVACVVLSLVDGQANPVHHCCSVRPIPTAYKDGLSPLDFDSFTRTDLYYPPSDSSRSPGPVALIRFQIWEKGKVDVDRLMDRLRSAVRHALWDVMMEYHLLTAPIAEMLTSLELATSSEFSTPSEVISKPDKPFDDTTGKEQAFSFFGVGLKMKPPSVFSSSSPMSFAQKEFEAVQVAMDVEALQQQEKCELGEMGNLHQLYAELMPDWLEFGRHIDVPSVQKHSLCVVSRHAIETVLVELQILVSNIMSDTSPKSFRMEKDKKYILHQLLPGNRDKKLVMGMPSGNKSYLRSLPGQVANYIVLGRNVQQWRECTGRAQDSFSFKSYKDFQRFPPEELFEAQFLPSGPASTTSTPGIIGMSYLPLSPSLQLISSTATSAVSFASEFGVVPRQRLLLVVVRDKQFILYTYNWAPDLNVRFFRDASLLVDWHNSRTAVLNSIVSQKLGLFINQPVTRKTSKHVVQPSIHMKEGAVHKTLSSTPTPYLPTLTADFEQLVKCSSPPKVDPMSSSVRRNPVSTATFSITSASITSAAHSPAAMSFLEALRDARTISVQPTFVEHGPSNDFLLVHGQQVLRSIDRDAYGIEKHFYLNWESREFQSRIPVNLIRQHARIEHYVLTPLLFPPQWRLQIAAARDHTVPCIPPHESLNPPAPLLQDIRHQHKIGSRQHISEFVRIPGHAAQNSMWNFQDDNSWHFHVCSIYIKEVLQYLQTLGFVPLQLSDLRPKRKNQKSKVSSSSLWTDDGIQASHPFKDENLVRFSNWYLQRLPLGGMLMLELTISEPYCAIMLYAMKSIRIPLAWNRTLNSQLTLPFLDEIDKIKVLMHLHSFTYDYHLRSVHTYLSGRQISLQPAFHIAGFLDDFMKYYQKSPNFARNLIYTGTLPIWHTLMPSHQLFDYINRNDKQYQIRVLKMKCSSMDTCADMNNEYVLVQIITKKVVYHDSNDIPHTDEFNVTLLISRNPTLNTDREVDRHSLVLKYYIILTSCRELYPKPALDRQPGTFRTVATRTMAFSEQPSETELPQNAQFSKSNESEKTPSNGILNTAENARSTTLENSNFKNSPTEANVSSSTDDPILESALQPAVSGIRQEAVNYMGFFSSHEELMHKIMMGEVHDVKCRIESIISQAMVHCRRDLLWDRLFRRSVVIEDTRRKKEDTNCVTYTEFTELLKLVVIKPLADVDSELAPLMAMPLTWYQGLVKALATKYGEMHRLFMAPDGNTHHVIVLSEQCRDCVMLMSVDLHSVSANLSIVYRVQEPSQDHPTIQDTVVHSLIEGFVNSCCFHLWSCLL